MRSELHNLNVEKIFCINLKRRSDRKVFAEKQHMSIGLNDVIFWDAVDGSKEQLTSSIDRLTPGMLGCFHTHRNILKHCLDNNIESYLVLEDDAVFEAGINQFLKYAIPVMPADWEFCYLGYTEYGGPNTHIKEVNDFWVVPNCCWGTQAFMIKGRSAMEKIYDAMKQIHMQIDEQLSNIILRSTRVKSYAIYPRMVGQNFEIGSDIQDNVKTIQQI